MAEVGMKREDISKSLMMCIDIKCPICTGHVPFANATNILSLYTLKCIYCSHTFCFTKKQIKELQKALESLQNEFAIIREKLSR